MQNTVRFYEGHDSYSLTSYLDYFTSRQFDEMHEYEEWVSYFDVLATYRAFRLSNAATIFHNADHTDIDDLTIDPTNPWRAGLVWLALELPLWLLTLATNFVIDALDLILYGLLYAASCVTQSVAFIVYEAFYGVRLLLGMAGTIIAGIAESLIVLAAGAERLILAISSFSMGATLEPNCFQNTSPRNYQDAIVSVCNPFGVDDSAAIESFCDHISKTGISGPILFRSQGQNDNSIHASWKAKFMSAPIAELLYPTVQVNRDRRYMYMNDY